MTDIEFEEFYEYITKYDTTIVAGYDETEVIENYWKELINVPYEMVVEKAKELYKSGLVFNLNLLSPKVFSGENPNPGLFGRVISDYSS